jgi:hypothetical protein
MDNPPDSFAGSPGPRLATGLGTGLPDGTGAVDADAPGEAEGSGLAVGVACGAGVTGGAGVGVGAIVGAGVGTAVTVIETTLTGLVSEPSEAR